MKVLVAIWVLWSVFFIMSPLEMKKWKSGEKDGLDYSKSTTRNLVASTAVEIQGKTGIGPEDVEVDENGNIYAGLDNGDFIRIAKDGSYKVLVNTGGRVLGIDRAPSGEFILADAEKGLLSYDIERNKLKTLLEEVNGMKLVFTDDVDVSSNGIVYFSDAAQRYNVRNYVFDAIEHNNDGRIISYNLKTNQSELLADGLYFANGVALSEGEDFLLFNESWIRRVSKLWLKGEKKGQVEVFADNLPGIPDGISRGESGIFGLLLLQKEVCFYQCSRKLHLLEKCLFQLRQQPYFLNTTVGLMCLDLVWKGLYATNLSIQKGQTTRILRVLKRWTTSFISGV